MKILNANETKAVHGGANLVITQQISTEGVSPVCLTTLANMLQLTEKTDEQMMTYILSGCTFNELDIIGDRLDAAAFTTVEFK